MFAITRILAVGLLAVGWTTAHIQITYPGQRGDNLHTNGTPPEFNPNSIGVDHYENGTTGFPYGMQWIYPCGGMPTSRNRTKWPVEGGAVSLQPGWFPGHSRAQLYINVGINAPGQDAPPNMSHPVIPPFEIIGPTNQEYPGQFCFPQVPLPPNLSFKIGDNITIQIVELAQHGAALYNCVDVTLADPSEVTPVTPQNCYNSSTLGFQLVFTTAALTADAFPGPAPFPLAFSSPWVAGGIFSLALAAMASSIL